MRIEIFLPRLLTYWLARIMRKQMKLISHYSYDAVLYQALTEWIEIQKESRMPAGESKGSIGASP